MTNLWLLLALSPEPYPIAICRTREICEGLVMLLRQAGLPAATVALGG